MKPPNFFVMPTSDNVIDGFSIERALKKILNTEKIFRKNKFYSAAEVLSDLRFRILQEPVTRTRFITQMLSRSED